MVYVVDAEKIKRVHDRAVHDIERLVGEHQRALAADIGHETSVPARHRKPGHKPRESLEQTALAGASQRLAADARADTGKLAALDIAVSGIDQLVVLRGLGHTLVRGKDYLEALAPVHGDADGLLLGKLESDGVVGLDIGEAEASFLVRARISVAVRDINPDLIDRLKGAVEDQSVEGHVGTGGQHGHRGEDRGRC